MKWIDSIGKQSRALILLEGFLLVAVLGVIDYATGEELFFLEFYLLPVILLTWFVSEKAGIAVSMVSGIFWFVDDVLGRPPQGRMAISYSNVFLKMLVFIIFTRILSALKNAIARERLAEQKKAKRELEIARKVQDGLFPQVFPQIRTLDYYGICEAANGVGGDYYDFLLLSTDTLGIAIGDVSGKGISAALLMSNLQAMLRSNALLYKNTSDRLVYDINNQLYRSTTGSKFATFFYGIYEDECGRLTYVNAGHNPPFLLRNGCISQLNSSGTVIGLFPNREYQQVQLQLQTGDLLLLFTDGLVEAQNMQEEEFGEERLHKWLLDNGAPTARDLISSLLKEVGAFVGEAQQHDDLTVVALKIL